MSATLEATGLSKRFGAVAAVDGLDVALAPGEIRGLIGPNGSGKSTTMHLISGYLRPDAGTIRLNGQVLNRLAVHRRAALGLGRTFQTPAVFLQLSVLDNVLVGCHAVDRVGTRVGDLFFRPWASKRVFNSLLERSASTLDSVGLGDRMADRAEDLSYGQQKLLGLAQALVSDPRVLLMDEPLAGLGSVEMDRVIAIVKDLRLKGGSVLFAEHNVPEVMQLCDRITVLNFGTRIAEGTPGEIQRHPEVLDAYLGREDREEVDAHDQ